MSKILSLISRAQRAEERNEPLVIEPAAPPPPAPELQQLVGASIQHVIDIEERGLTVLRGRQVDIEHEITRLQEEGRQNLAVIRASEGKVELLKANRREPDVESDALAEASADAVAAELGRL